jgi:hypothetical protein
MGIYRSDDVVWNHLIRRVHIPNSTPTYTFLTFILPSNPHLHKTKVIKALINTSVSITTQVY